MSQAIDGVLKVSGTVSPGFEPVKDLFEQNMHSRLEDRAQLCVYVKGEKVIDLVAKPGSDDAFNPDSLVNIWSSGKSLEALSLAHLVSQGLLKYDEKIATYWPEFAQNGKDTILVSDLMRHQAGLQRINFAFGAEDLTTAAIKNNHVGRVIERAFPAKPVSEKYRRIYHALSRGWVANELFRRVEPEGRTIGEFLREDIAGPLNADVIVGMREDEVARMQKMKPLSPLTYVSESVKPIKNGRKSALGIFDILGILFHIACSILDMLYLKLRSKFGGESEQAPSQARSKEPKVRFPLKGLSPLKDKLNTYNTMTSGDFAYTESTSFSAKASARGLAKIAAMLAAKGRFDNKEYLSEEAWQALHTEPETRRLGMLGYRHLTRGGINAYHLSEVVDHNAVENSLNKGRQGFFGWMGMGGSIFQWYPDLEIGFGFVPTSLHTMDPFCERGKRYQEKVLQCVRQMNEEAQLGDPQQADNQAVAAK